MAKEKNIVIRMETNDKTLEELLGKLPNIDNLKDLRESFEVIKNKDSLVLDYEIKDLELVLAGGMDYKQPALKATQFVLKETKYVYDFCKRIGIEDKEVLVQGASNIRDNSLTDSYKPSYIDMHIKIDVSKLYELVKDKYGLYDYDEILRSATDNELVEYFNKIDKLRRAILRQTKMIERVNEEPNQYYGVIPFDNSVYVACYYDTPSALMTPLGMFKITGGGTTNNLSATDIFDNLGIKYTKVAGEHTTNIGTYGAVYRIDMDHLGNEYSKGWDKIRFILGSTTYTTQLEHRASYDMAKETFRRIHEKLPDLLMKEENIYAKTLERLEVIDGVAVIDKLSGLKVIDNTNWFKQFGYDNDANHDIVYKLNEILEKGLQYFLPDSTQAPIKIAVFTKGIKGKTPGKYYDNWEDVPEKRKTMI